MKKRFYKLFIAILAVAAFAFAFTACNKDTDPDPGPGPGPAPEKYTVTYAAGGAVGTVPTSGEYAAGETFSLLAATQLSKDGYVFGKWNDGTADYAAGATYTMPAANVTFTATWVEAHTVTFTTTFAADATTGPAPQKYAEGETVTLPENTFVQKTEYQNYIFTGWKMNGNVYQPGATFVMPANDVTIQAQWTAGVKVAFDLNGGTGNLPAKYYVKGSSVILPTQQGIIKTGYTLTGWKCDDEDQTVYNLGASYTVGNYDATFTAVWTAVSGQKHSVTVFKSIMADQIDSVQGTAPTYEDMAAGETFTVPTDGLTFAHYHIFTWNVYVFEVDSKTGTGDWVQQGVYEPGATVTMPDCNIQLKARWVANYVTISFDANGGTGTMAPVTNKQYNSNYMLPANGFTAPAGGTFQGWSDTANGSVLGNSAPKLCEPLVKADDTLTLYAVWQVQAQPVSIDGMLGHWTGTAHTLDIIKDDSNEYYLGYAVLDGKYFLQVYEASGEFGAISPDYDVFYSIALSGTTLTLTPDEGAAITLTEKSALTSANGDAFAGKWIKEGTTQNWIITESSVMYGITSLSAANMVIIGDNIVMWYEAASYYFVYVLTKSGGALVGYYDANEYAPVAVTFVAGNYLVLYVEGAPNQIVASGSAPDESKIIKPEAPEKGKTFDKWVKAGTETEFNISAAMTADAYIVATWKDGESGTTYAGRYTISGKIIVKLVLSDDFKKLTYTLDDGTSKTVNLTDDSSSNWKPNNYGEDASYYEVQFENVAHYILVKADGSKIWICNSGDTPLAGAQFFNSTDDDWVAISTAEWQALAGINKYFEEFVTIGTTKFLGIQFLYDTNFDPAMMKIKTIYVSNDIEKVLTTSINLTASNGNLLVFSSSSYEIIIGKKKSDGNFYVVSFKYSNNYDTTERALTGTSAPSWQ